MLVADRVPVVACATRAELTPSARGSHRRSREAALRPALPRPAVFGLSLALAVLSFTASGCGTSSPRQSDADRLNSMIGIATRADIIQQIGPPQQTIKVDGDEFFIYPVAVRNPLAELGSGLGSMAAGYQGTVYTPPPQPQRTYILRFDGVTGRLKGWTFR